jgi:membrane associated rhomboid family serine protease
MNPLAIALGAVIAALIGSVFFLIRPAKSYKMLWLSILFAWIGFAAGHFAAELGDFRLWTAGALNLGGAIPGALVALLLLRVLALKEWK